MVLLACIGCLVIGVVIGWACGRATMVAKYRRLERVLRSYVDYKNR